MSELSSNETMIIGFIAIGFALAVVWALRNVIAHLIIFVLSLFIIYFFINEPDYSQWWALVGVFLIVGQLMSAKEALFDKPAAKRKELEEEESSKLLEEQARKAMIEMNEARKNGGVKED